jgi:2-keto-3-deoxy-L-fuconate dehydrogenase
MSGRLEGLRALVTAAGAGIGRSSAIAFAAEGARVLATDIDQAALASLAAESGVETARLDVTDAAAIAALADRAGPFDVLMNVAGWVPHGDALATSEADWGRAFEINVTSMFRMLQAVLPAMLERGSGSIVNLASVVSSLKGAPNRFAYGATKGAVIGLTKAVAADYVTRGVRCNCICPGTIDTPSLAGRMAAAEDPVGARAAFIARQPMGRLGTAQEVAALAVHLAGPESAFTTGAAYVIDGGWSG